MDILNSKTVPDMSKPADLISSVSVWRRGYNPFLELWRVKNRRLSIIARISRNVSLFCEKIFGAKGLGMRL